MSQILVRDLAPETVEQLKKRAKQNRRSLQSEARIILEEAANLIAEEANRKQSREEFLRYLEWSRQQHGPQSTDSVDLIREDRER